MEPVALALAAAAVAWCIPRVPSWSGALTSPVHAATVAGAATVALLAGTRALGTGRRVLVFERRFLAVFLASMPLVYLANDVVTTGGARAWTLVELAALPVYGGVALAGLRRPALLAAGIALHGIAWDAWHVGLHRAVPDWYAVGCALLDVTLAAYVALRGRTWSGAVAGAVGADRDRVVAGEAGVAGPAR